MRNLITQSDGRRFAVYVLGKLRDAGPEKCRLNTPYPFKIQADALILALVEIKERGTVDACAGFAAVLTDMVGTRSPEAMPELYELMESQGVRRYKLKRLVNRGLRLAVLAVNREAETPIDDSRDHR